MAKGKVPAVVVCHRYLGDSAVEERGVQLWASLLVTQPVLPADMADTQGSSAVRAHGPTLDA